MEDPEPDVPGAVHAPDRRLDVAFAALAEVAPGACVTLLAGTGDGWTPPSVLVRQLPEARWLQADDHPLTFIDPEDHLRVHQAWLQACQGDDRCGRVRVRTCAPLPADDGSTAEPGWYDVVLLDLVGVTGIDAVVAILTGVDPDLAPPEVPDEADETATRAVSWFRGTTSFRLRLASGGIIEGGTRNVDEVLGRPLTALVGTTVTTLAHPDDLERAAAAWREIVASPVQQPPTRVRIAMADGSWRWFEITSWNLLDLAAYQVVISDFRDVQAQVEAEEAREATTRSLDRLVRVLDEIDDVVMVGGLESGLVYLNAAARAIAGPDAVGTHLSEHVDLEISALAEASIVPELRALRRWTGDFDLEVGGQRRRMAATVSPVAAPDGIGSDDAASGAATGGEIFYGVVMRDVTSAHAHAVDLAEQARRDPLTGLPNRLALMEVLEASRTSGPAHGTVSVCFIDLDNLKIVNDGLGHSAGDRLLRAVGDQLLAGHPGAVFRFGGDEFVVVLQDRSASEALEGARAVLDAIERVQEPGVAAHLTA
ncbi:MAG: diguanylate cyclase, partial [Actinobacteria bacterium]|nr:diguanylate cyclase [Actinomycetota bacterium]